MRIIYCTAMVPMVAMATCPDGEGLPARHWTGDPEIEMTCVSTVTVADDFRDQGSETAAAYLARGRRRLLPQGGPTTL